MMLVRLSMYALLMWCASSAWAAEPIAPADRDLAREVSVALEEEGLAGAVWSTLDADGTIRTGAAGYRNAPARVAMTPDARMHVGSLAKTLIATGVLQLVSAGRLDLDAPVSTLLPDLRFDNPWEAGSPVRLRHLLDHTAGLDDMRLWQMFSTQPTPDAPLRAAFTRDRSVLGVRTRPGSRFSYSNMGYTLAAMVIEAVARERYETWLDRELLRPLGMDDSTFAFTTQVGPGADPRLAWGHHDIVSPAPALPVYLRPAGQFTTTARDLALLARFLMGDGRVDGRTIVQPGLLRAMGRASTTDAARAGLQAGYGLGLSRHDRHGVVGLCHGGSIVGFHAMLCLFPGTQGGKAFAVVHNTDGDGLDTGRFDALLIHALGIAPPPAATAARDPRGIADWQGRYVPAPNRFASFRYVDFLSDSARLQWDGKALRLSRLQRPTRTLTPAGGMRFTASDRSTASHVLLEGEGGKRLLSDGQRTYRKASAAGYRLLWANLALGVAGLLWFLLVVPIRGARSGRAWRQPGFWGAVSLLLPIPLFFTQSFMQLGDRTPASIAVYLAGIALPLAMAWQLLLGVRRWRLAGDWADTLAALLALQWCVVLFAWDMLPFAMWR